jgi:hypothetical protein
MTMDYYAISIIVIIFLMILFNRPVRNATIKRKIKLSNGENINLIVDIVPNTNTSNIINNVNKNKNINVFEKKQSNKSKIKSVTINRFSKKNMHSNLVAFQEVPILKNNILTTKEILVPINDIELREPHVIVNNDKTSEIDRKPGTIYGLKDSYGYIFFPSITWSPNRSTIFVTPLQRKYYCDKNNKSQECSDFKNSYCFNNINNKSKGLCINGNFLDSFKNQ